MRARRRLVVNDQAERKGTEKEKCRYITRKRRYRESENVEQSLINSCW